MRYISVLASLKHGGMTEKEIPFSKIKTESGPLKMSKLRRTCLRNIAHI